MSPFGLKFSQMILHTETSKLMYNWSFLFEVLHKPTLLPSTFNSLCAFFTDWHVWHHALFANLHNIAPAQYRLPVEQSQLIIKETSISMKVGLKRYLDIQIQIQIILNYIIISYIIIVGHAWVLYTGHKKC